MSKNSGGAERTAFSILKYLRSLNFDVVYCTLATKSFFSSSRRLENGFRHYTLPKRNPFRSQDGALNKLLFHFFEIFNFVTFFDFWKLAKKEGFRFIFFHNPKGFSFGIWLCAIFQRIPFCLVNHDYYNICVNSCFFKKNTGTCKKQCVSCRTFHFFPWLLHFFSEFSVFLSLNQKRIFNSQGWFLQKKAFIVPPLIDAKKIKPKRLYARKVGFIGRLDPTKGVDDFLTLCNLCKATDITFYIQAFRSDSNLDFYKSRSTYLSNLKWAHKNNLSFLREMDFLVIPSKWEEPFGRIFLESLSCGTPCIGYPRGAIQEIMTGDLSIFITENCDSMSIKQKLCFFYNNERDYFKYSSACIKQHSLFSLRFYNLLNTAIKRI